jgi:3-oxoacyl-[acyl-carrier protein] reductase
MNAIITGATKGMGKAIAQKLAHAGYNLAICSRNQTEIETFKTELLRINPNATIIGLETDCSDPKQVQRFSGFVQQHFDMVDVLVNNAGTYIPASILDETDDILHLQMQLNFHTAYHLCRVFGRAMRDRRKGHIINICSIAAIKPIISAGSYTVTKVALLGLTRVLREELMPYHVKVTAILPGSTLTDSWKGTDIPPDRFVSADDVADTVLNCLRMSAGGNIDEVIIRPLEGEI